MESIDNISPGEQGTASILTVHDEGVLSNLPPEGEAMPSGGPSFDVSLLNRKQRRMFKRKHHVNIVGTNRPFVKGVA